MLVTKVSNKTYAIFQNNQKCAFGAKTEPAFNEEAVNKAQKMKSDIIRAEIVHTNLLHKLKNDTSDMHEIDGILNGIKEDERFLGCLPFEWIKDTKKEERGKKTLEVQKIFSNFASQYSDAYDTDKKKLKKLMEETGIKDPFSEKLLGGAIAEERIAIVNLANESLVKNLERVLNADAKLELLENQGQMGMVFKLTVNDKSYALKIFPITKEPFYRLEHGKTMEIANALAYNHCMKPSKCSRFYFGKIAGKDDYDGFMLTEFVNGESAVVKKPPKMRYERFILYDDFKENSINGKVIDYGCIYRKYKNKTGEKIAKELIEAYNSNEKAKVSKIKAKYKNTPELEDVLDSF